MTNQQEVTVVEEEVVLKEVASPLVIETGDSVKVKQVLDDSLMEALTEAGYEPNYSWENFKFLLMFLACLFALLAQFYPLPFPESRLLLGICCAAYFIISTVLQALVVFVDKDTIALLKPKKDVIDHEMRIRTSFPRFQEYYSLIVQGKDELSPATTAKMYVGKYFTSKGEFDEEGFHQDVKRHMEKYAAKSYIEIEYNHKLD